MTMAVEDRARHEPMMTAAAGVSPASAAMPPITAVRQDDLQAAEAEHQAAHGQQALVGQLQADQEQQEDDAELGDAGDVLGVDHRDPVEERQLVHERAEPQRPEDGAGAEIAEHRAQPEAAHQRHDDAGRAEHDQRVAVGVEIDRMSPAIIPRSRTSDH